MDDYQNQDLDNLNPLQTKEDQELVNKKFKLFGWSLPEDPKLRLLVGLGAVVLLLLLLAMITSFARRTPRAPGRVTPTPTPDITPLPTENPDTTKLPQDLRDKFQEVDNNVNTGINFNPPQIDTEVGL
ncbi:MAG: hypothetical protein WC851_04960 [Candidatus Shapirobacteria bacterium]|jgi:hypothetical protein